MKAIILAGGEGTRLRPYTTVLPKPLMPVGDYPVLEIVLRQLKHFGIRDIVITVGYLAELIEAYFGDGSRFGVKIAYSREPYPLGTAGPLTLVQGLDDTFLVMNGDLLTNIDYSQLVRFHTQNEAVATIATFRREIKIDFGIVETDVRTNEITDYVEKPILHHKVSMGVYVFEPEVVKYIPRNIKFDFPALVLELIGHKRKVFSYPFDGYWLDIGRHDDYEAAVAEFANNRSQFLFE